jgi:sortase A
MSPFRRALDIAGRVLVGAGIILLLFTAYQIWGTSIQESHTQAAMRTTLAQEAPNHHLANVISDANALDRLPTGPPVTAPHTQDPPEGNPVGDIRIPVIGVNQVMVEGTNTPDLRKGPGHYIGTPLPGQVGNAAVAGHRTTYGHPFYNLDSVKAGDPIVVTTLQGIFVYDTIRSQVVSPSDTSVLDNTPSNLLTLTTCNPRFSASTRLVVTAQLAHSQLFPNTIPSTHSTQLGHTSRRSPQSDQLAGGSDSATQAVLWGALFVVVGAAVLVLGRRFRSRRWPIWIVGAGGLLVVLYAFFTAVSPLLPASY